MLLDQKSSCDVMIDEKNKLINDFQQVCLYSFYYIVLYCYICFIKQTPLGPHKCVRLKKVSAYLGVIII
jgi:hypothetical protein